MTIETIYKPVTFINNGIGPYTFTFEVISESDLTVFFDGKFSDITYTVLLNGPGPIHQGGRIIFDSAPPNSVRQITVKRCTEPTQTVDYLQYGAFPAETHEFALDKLTMLQQEECDDCNEFTQTTTEVESPFCIINEFPSNFPKSYCTSYSSNLFGGPAVLHEIPYEGSASGDPSFSWIMHSVNQTQITWSMGILQTPERGLFFAPSHPTTDDDLAYATVGFVLDNSGGGGGPFLPLSGGTMTGPIVMTDPPNNPQVQMIWDVEVNDHGFNYSVDSGASNFPVMRVSSQGAAVGQVALYGPRTEGQPTMDAKILTRADDILNRDNVTIYSPDGDNQSVGMRLQVAQNRLDSSGLEWSNNLDSSVKGTWVPMMQFSTADEAAGEIILYGPDAMTNDAVPKILLTKDNVQVWDNIRFKAENPTPLTGLADLSFGDIFGVPTLRAEVPREGVNGGAFQIALIDAVDATQAFTFSLLDLSTSMQGARPTLQLPAMPHQDDDMAAATVKFVLDAIGGGGGIPEAPTDGQNYLRNGLSAAWVAEGASSGEANTSSNTGAGEPLALPKQGVDLPFKSLVAGNNVTISATGTEVTINADDQTGAFLPLAGGRMDAGAVIEFAVSSGNLGNLAWGDAGGGTNGFVLGAIGNADAQHSIIMGAGKSLSLEATGRIRAFGKTSAVADEDILTKADGDTLYGGPSSGEANTSSNAGVGAGLALPKVGVDLPFKSLIGGDDIALVEGGTTVTINYTGATGGGEANTASNLPGGDGIFRQKVGVDLQFKSLVGGSGVSLSTSNDTITITNDLPGVTQHGDLLGLGDDDHAQYHTDARGDARYYQKSETYTRAEVDALIAAIRQLPDPTGRANQTLHVNTGGTAWVASDELTIIDGLGGTFDTSLFTDGNITASGDVTAFLGS